MTDRSAANHTATRAGGAAAVARLIVGATATALALLAIDGCNDPQAVTLPELFPVSDDAAALLESAFGGPWSGVWSVEGASLDSSLRITHLGNEVYVVEGISSVNTVMHGIANAHRLKAHEGGRGNRMELAMPIPANPCMQGWQIPPSADPVPMLVCRTR